MTINIHAGHNPDGKTACGAVGLIKESSAAREVKDKVLSILRANGHTVHDCTCQDGTSQNNVLVKIVNKCNEYTADIDVSIHFNSGRNDYAGDGSIGGIEIYTYSTSSKAAGEAKRVCDNIAALGFKNRGVKTADFYVLRKTKAPAMLIECCFVDDADDVKLFNADKMAEAIASGITGQAVSASITPATATACAIKRSVPFRVKVLTNALNIRSKAGMDGVVVGCIKDNGTYTIEEVSGSWGRLHSNAGWICISTKYVKYI